MEVARHDMKEELAQWRAKHHEVTPTALLNAQCPSQPTLHNFFTAT